LKRKGLDRALVAASGDIAIGNPPPKQRGWKIGIATIDALKNETARTVLLRNAGISTSGDTEQYTEIGGVRYSHIVDPATGLGLTNRLQVTIIGPNATSTDALATGVSVLGPERGMTLVDSLPRTAALIFTKTNGHERVFVSRRFETIGVRKWRRLRPKLESRLRFD
jgi:thiamine biosynthesis lipoprotein